jgi:hypothetical protein
MFGVTERKNVSRLNQIPNEKTSFAIAREKRCGRSRSRGSIQKQAAVRAI